MCLASLFYWLIHNPVLKTETKSVSDILSFKGLYLSSLKWLCEDILCIPTMLPTAPGTEILQQRNVEVATSDHCIGILGSQSGIWCGLLRRRRDMDIWAPCLGGLWAYKDRSQRNCGNDNDVQILSIIKRHPPISSIVPKTRELSGGGGGGRSKFDKIGMFCDCLECLIPAYNERTL